MLRRDDYKANVPSQAAQKEVQKQKIDNKKMEEALVKYKIDKKEIIGRYIDHKHQSMIRVEDDQEEDEEDYEEEGSEDNFKTQTVNNPVTQRTKPKSVKDPG